MCRGSRDRRFDARADRLPGGGFLADVDGNLRGVAVAVYLPDTALGFVISDAVHHVVVSRGAQNRPRKGA